MKKRNRANLCDCGSGIPKAECCDRKNVSNEKNGSGFQEVAITAELTNSLPSRTRSQKEIRISLQQKEEALSLLSLPLTFLEFLVENPLKDVSRFVSLQQNLIINEKDIEDIPLVRRVYRLIADILDGRAIPVTEQGEITPDYLKEFWYRWGAGEDRNAFYPEYYFYDGRFYPALETAKTAAEAAGLIYTGGNQLYVNHRYQGILEDPSILFFRLFYSLADSVDWSHSCRSRMNFEPFAQDVLPVVLYMINKRCRASREPFSLIELMGDFLRIFPPIKQDRHDLHPRLMLQSMAMQYFVFFPQEMGLIQVDAYESGDADFKARPTPLFEKALYWPEEV